ncbi:hypothetical protein ATY41_00930 [Leifsonia xyli subsp. xyli]|nr:hypothetical protein [Leifsonia xyli]ODA91287.1 hypothetical protein ATY41_00930 [Leifsonia xyli subsp. xyli]
MTKPLTESMPDIANLGPTMRSAAPLEFISRRVLDDALATARPGAVLLLEGPSGSGKTSAVLASDAKRDAIVATADGLAAPNSRRSPPRLLRPASRRS